MIIETQKPVVDFLSSPNSFGGAPVQRIDTHLSHVFLVGARAYKIKRAIRYDFADFSTLEKRKTACENEVRVNRRTAPGMYLGAIPVFRNEAGIGWKSSGEIVEWAVEMVRFEPGKQFDEMLARRELRDADIEALADTIARLHLHADEILSPQASNSVIKIIDQLTTSISNSGAAREEAVERWSALARAKFDQYHSILDARGRHGWVRHCHGDLHLANICMLKGAPTPFDAIEFNESLTEIDVLYDIAFLIMDFIHHNQNSLANLLLNRYLSATRDYAGLSLLPLFLSMRAAVRAMVLGLPAQSEKSHQAASRYFDLALEFLIGENDPRLVAIGGYSGAGKSTLARSLARELDHHYGAVILRSDVIRKRLAGVAPDEALDPEEYSDRQTAQVYQRLFTDARRALSAGQTVIADATFLAEPVRRKIEEIAQQTCVPFTGVWLTAPRDVLFGRVSSRSGDASDATAEIVLQQIRQGAEAKGWRIIDASDSPSTTLRRTLGLLS